MKVVFAVFVTALSASAQMMVPDGTKVRVRLDQSISSSTAEEGQTVELSVTEPVRVNEQVVIPEGSRVTGTITQAREKRTMGRAGKLDFSIDRVRSADGEWIPLRYTVTKKNGESHATRTGVLTASAAVLFWPAAPAFLLIKGKDVNINKGVVFEAFTDQDHVLKTSTGPAAPAGSNAFRAASGSAAVAIESDVNGADIEVDGAYVGSTPTTLSLAAGPHQITVRSGNAMWQRVLQVSSASTVTVNARLEGTRVASRGTK